VRRAELEWRWRTTAEAAQLLGISAAAVRQRVRRGQLHAYKLDGRLYIDAHDLDAAIRDGGYDESQLHVKQMGPAPLERPSPRHQEV
jgi:excisionase family DNA binding protein